MCISGSANSSTMVRSSSMSSPCVSISTCLPNWRDRSRTSRAIRRKSGPIGHQPHRHRGLLQFRGDARQMGDLALQQRALERRQLLVVTHQRLGNHHFARHVDQIVQLGGIHLNRHRLLTPVRGSRARGCGACYRVRSLRRSPLRLRAASARGLTAAVASDSDTAAARVASAADSASPGSKHEPQDP